MTLTDLQRDILVKAAEGIQEGMWCQGAWFTTEVRGHSSATGGLVTDEAFYGLFSVEQLSRFYRCAEGELALRTVALGGRRNDFDQVSAAVASVVASNCSHHDREPGVDDVIPRHNDACQVGLDAFEAGQEWARIFREVAES